MEDDKHSDWKRAKNDEIEDIMRESAPRYGRRVDATRLLIQWLGVGIITALLFLVLVDKKAKTAPELDSVSDKYRAMTVQEISLLVKDWDNDDPRWSYLVNDDRKGVKRLVEVRDNRLAADDS